MTRIFSRLILLSLCALALHGKAETIAFFYAMDADLAAFKAQAAADGQPLQADSRTIPVFRINSHRVYAVKMYTGPVATAVSAQALLACTHCDLALSVGPVGSLSEKLTVGSWHPVEKIIAYQKGSWTESGFQLSPDATLTMQTDVPGKPMLPGLFQSSGPLTVASGEAFVTSDRFHARLHDRTGADAVDMNLFGLQTVCSDHHVPLVCWRIVSDRADNTGDEEFRKFQAAYKGDGGKAMAELISNLKPQTDSASK